MQLYPFLAPDDGGGSDEKRFTASEMQQLLTEEKQRYEAALQSEADARKQAEAALQKQEAALRAYEMREMAQEALRARQLPEQLIGALSLESEDALTRTLSAAENAFRAALEEGVRTRLRGQAPGQIPLPQKTRRQKPLSYQQAAANYLSDRENH